MNFGVNIFITGISDGLKAIIKKQSESVRIIKNPQALSIELNWSLLDLE